MVPRPRAEPHTGQGPGSLSEICSPGHYAQPKHFLPAAITGGLFSADGRKGGGKTQNCLICPMSQDAFLCVTLFFFIQVKLIYHKIHHFKEYHSVPFSCSQCCATTTSVQSQNIFIIPQGNPGPQDQSTP